MTLIPSCRFEDMNPRTQEQWRLREFLGYQPGTPQLRRHSSRVTDVFMRGSSMRAIAETLGVHYLLIEDAVRWEMKRQGRKRGRRA